MGAGIETVRLQHATRTVLRFSLPIFFGSVILLGAGLGDQQMLETLTAYLGVAVAVTAFVYALLAPSGRIHK